MIQPALFRQSLNNMKGKLCKHYFQLSWSPWHPWWYPPRMRLPSMTGVSDIRNPIMPAFSMRPTATECTSYQMLQNWEEKSLHFGLRRLPGSLLCSRPWCCRKVTTFILEPFCWTTVGVHVVQQDCTPCYFPKHLWAYSDESTTLEPAGYASRITSENVSKFPPNMVYTCELHPNFW